MVVATLGKNLRPPVPKWSNDQWLFCLFKNQELQTKCCFNAEVDVGDLSAFVTEWRGANGQWSKIIYNQELHEPLRQNTLYYTYIAAGNWNSN